MVTEKSDKMQTSILIEKNPKTPVTICNKKMGCPCELALQAALQQKESGYRLLSICNHSFGKKEIIGWLGCVPPVFVFFLVMFLSTLIHLPLAHVQLGIEIVL
jgi:hypothetical protein